MPTECSQDSFDFGTVDGRSVVGTFDGGAITSDGGALLLGATDRAIGLVERFARCFSDARDPALIEHTIETLVGQRIFGLALGYEDLNDHDQLRTDPVMATLAGKLEARREDCAPLAGKSTLNRLEQSLRGGIGRYHKIGYDAAAVEALFVELFLDAHPQPPGEIVLDLDATDDPLHGHQEGRFFHGYYDCYCYLPLYVFCGRHLLAAKLRRANIDAAHGAREEIARIVTQIRRRWPRVRIILRADSGICRDDLMSWCEGSGSLATRASPVPSGAIWSWPAPKRARRGGRRAASPSSPSRPVAAGAGTVASSPRPNGSPANPIRASSSPR
jgi:hypothetical protein